MSNSNNDKKIVYPGTWYTFPPNFKYKLMRYQYSCFPCSLHTILANLGLPADGNGIEDAWDRMHPNGLGESAPQHSQIQQYLNNTPEIRPYNTQLFTQQNFPTIVAAADIAAEVAKRFIDVSHPVGMIAGAAHAEVFFHTANNKFIHYCPEPDAETIFCHEIVFNGIQAVTGSNGRNVVLLKFRDETMAHELAAECVMLIG